MPGQVFPPEGFGPWAIADERLTAATRVRAVAPHYKAFISDLRWMSVTVASSWSPGSDDLATRGGRHSPDPLGRRGGRRTGRYRPGSQHGALPPWVGRLRDLPRCNVGIDGGRRKCPLAIIAMFPPHRRRVPRRTSDPRAARHPGGSVTRRDEFV